MNKTFTMLFRGHKHEDYLKTQKQFPCFSESKSIAISYGKGANDVSNPDVENGFVTTVEFHGKITPIEVSVGLDLFKLPEKLKNLQAQHDAIKCKDGVVIVFNMSKLKNPIRELA